MEKTLKYSVHAYGELEEAGKCPTGTYYVDLEKRLFFFESDDKSIPYNVSVKIAEVAARIAVSTHIEAANFVLYIHKKFFLLDEKDVQKKDGKFTYDFRIEGEMRKVVETPIGTLYADKEKEAFYFYSANKDFMKPFLKKRFYNRIEADLDSEDPERQLNATCIMSILENWTELDDDDIVKEKTSN